jgi:hypothetical protein
VAETVDVSRRSAPDAPEGVAPPAMLVVWRRWWGAPDLLRRACRVMAESVGAVSAEVEVHVRDDVERVTAAGFPDEVTAQALREWKEIVATAHGDDVELRLEITRARGAAAVILRGAGRGDLDSALAPLIPVLERGRPRHGEVPELVHLAAGESWELEPRFPRDRMQSWVTAILLFFLVAPVIAIDATLSGIAGFFVSLAFLVILGLVFAGPIARAYAAALPAVSLDEATAGPRLRRLLVVAATAAVSTAVGAAVKALVALAT